MIGNGEPKWQSDRRPFEGSSMAGDWIPMRIDLADDPAVIAIATAVGIDEFSVVGRLHRLWTWANLHLASGNARGVTSEWVDRYLSAPGFAAAMHSAGWLRVRSDGIELPNFERWNSKGAKRRLLTARRVASHKSGKGNAEGNAPSVTNALPKGEKRREEDNSSSKSSAAEPRPPRDDATPKPEPAKKVSIPDTPHHRAIACFSALWQAKYGARYPFNAGKDGESIKWMLAQVGGSDAALKPIFERYLADSDPFYAAANHDISTLRHKFTRWLVETPRGESHASSKDNGTASSRGNSNAGRGSGRVEAPRSDYENVRRITVGPAGVVETADSAVPPGSAKAT